MAGGAYRDPEQARSIGRRLGWGTTERMPPPGAGAPGPRRAITGSPPPTHCWVIGLSGMPPRLPGLLLEWRRTSDSWSGLVAIAVPDTLITVMWLPAENLRPGSG